MNNSMNDLPDWIKNPFKIIDAEEEEDELEPVQEVQ